MVKSAALLACINPRPTLLGYCRPRQTLKKITLQSTTTSWDDQGFMQTRQRTGTYDIVYDGKFGDARQLLASERDATTTRSFVYDIRSQAMKQLTEFSDFAKIRLTCWYLWLRYESYEYLFPQADDPVPEPDDDPEPEPW
jgi:hypothetical protein